MLLILLQERSLQKKVPTYSIELADKIQNAAVPYVWIQGEERKIKVLSNMMVDLTSYVDLDCDPKELGVTELVYYPVLEKILEENDDLEDD